MKTVHFLAILSILLLAGCGDQATSDSTDTDETTSTADGATDDTPKDDPKENGNDPAEKAAPATPPPPVGFEIGDSAHEITGEDLDGVQFSLSDYRGKVVVLDFWGDW